MAKGYPSKFNNELVDHICKITGEDRDKVSKILIYINAKDEDATIFVGRIEDDE